VSFLIKIRYHVKKNCRNDNRLTKDFSHIYSLFYFLVSLSKGNSSLMNGLLNSLWSPSSYISDKRIYLFNELTSRFHNTNESAIAFLILSILVRISLPFPVIFCLQYFNFLNLTSFCFLLTDLFYFQTQLSNTLKDCQLTTFLLLKSLKIQFSHSMELWTKLGNILHLNPSILYEP
jgi:hypothetical protein